MILHSIDCPAAANTGMIGCNCGADPNSEVARLRAATALPCPGSALGERLRKLEAFVAAYDLWRSEFPLSASDPATGFGQVETARAALET